MQENSPHTTIQEGSKEGDTTSPKKSLQPEIQVPSHLIKFDADKDSFSFGTIGLYNTRREMAFYKVVAHIGS